MLQGMDGAHVQLNYPWEDQRNPDNSKLETPATQQQSTIAMLDTSMDSATYNQDLAHLSRGKQPGPNGIVNQLLQVLG